MLNTENVALLLTAAFLKDHSGYVVGIELDDMRGNVEDQQEMVVVWTKLVVEKVNSVRQQLVDDLLSRQVDTCMAT